MLSLIFGYIVLFFIVVFLGYTIYQHQTQPEEEGFYPRRWWGPGRRWGWRRPWLHDRGNWRPYGYYPAYSGYWKQCPSGVWCPQTLSCNNPECY